MTEFGLVKVGRKPPVCCFASAFPYTLAPWRAATVAEFYRGGMDKDKYQGIPYIGGKRMPASMIREVNKVD